MGEKRENRCFSKDLFAFHTIGNFPNHVTGGEGYSRHHIKEYAEYAEKFTRRGLDQLPAEDCMRPIAVQNETDLKALKLNEAAGARQRLLSDGSGEDCTRWQRPADVRTQTSGSENES